MRALLVCCVLALALGGGLTDAASRRHRLARLRPAHLQPLQHSAEAFVEAEAEADATVEADVAVEAEVEADAEAEAEADVAVDAEAQAAVAALVAAADAAHREQAMGEFARHHSAAERAAAGTTIELDVAADAGADAETGAGAYHANHLTACQSMHAYLAGLGGGFNAAAGRAIPDATVHANWIAAAAVAPLLAVQQRALHIVDYVRWGQRRGLAHGAVCTQLLLTPVVAAYDRRAAPVAPARHLTQYTIGLEWELHWLQVLPANDASPASSFPLWRSVRTNNPSDQPWVTLVTDHIGRLPLTKVHGAAMTIVEVVFGPAYCDAANSGAGTATDVAIGDSRLMVAHLKHVLENGAAPAMGGGPAVGAVDAFAFAATPAVEHGIRNRLSTNPTQHLPVTDWSFDNTYTSLGGAPYQTAGFADPTVIASSHGNVVYGGPQRTYVLRPAGQTPAGVVAATWAAQWTPVGAPNGHRNEYIQTNLLLPVSALASDRFAAAQTGAWRQAAVAAARRAARSYLLANGAVASVVALSAADRGDLLGAFTGLFHQTLYSIITNSKLYTRAQAGLGASTNKNWFDYMYKTSAHRVFTLLRPAATHVLGLLYAATDLRTGTTTADAAMNHLRVALAAAADPLVVAWATKMTGNSVGARGIRTVGRNALRDALRMAHPATNLANPNYSAAPSGSDPPAHVATGDRLPSVVIESRQSPNSLNTAVATGTIVQINAELVQLQRQFTWTGDNTAFCA